MFREIFLLTNSNLYSEPDLFKEITISVKPPTSEKKWSKIEPDLQEILEILQEGDKSLKSKGSKKISVKFLESDGTGIFYFETNSPIELPETKEVVLYKKQKNAIVELVFELVSIAETKIACKPVAYHSFMERRKYERISNNEFLIYAQDFEILQSKENINDYLTEEVSSIFQSLEEKYKLTHQNLELYYFNTSSCLTWEEKLVASEQKPIFVKITNEIESYPGNFLNLKEYYIKQNLYSLKIDNFKKKRIHSFILFPLFFKLNNKQIFIGCGYLWEIEPNTIPTSEIFVFEEIESKIASEILANKNTQVNEKQEIVNFSKGGILFKITNLEIAHAILARPKFFATIYKENFRGARLQLYARNIYQIEQDYYVGAEILGNPYSDENIQRYFNLISENTNE